MSFKSKQRAKHGHLFGDDPLNAALVSTSDDPLFSPISKTSQSSRTNSPVSTDPLSRDLRPASPLDTSSSTPVTARRTHKVNNGSSNSSNSIFGDIDVTKLGGTGNNGLYNSNNSSKRVSTTSLRSTTTLRSSKQFDEDEEDLFGGGRVSRTRVLNKATSPTPSLKKDSPPIAKNTLPCVETIIPSPRKATPPPTVVSPVAPPVADNNMKENEKSIEEKPASSSSFFASASRFFKASSNTTSRASSATSSIASVSNATYQVNPPKPEEEEEEKVIEQPQPQQQQRKIPQLPKLQPIKQQIAIVEEEEEEVEGIHLIEDEATRAFADDMITFRPKTIQPIYEDMNAISILDSPFKRLMPSASTPSSNSHTADVDDPWFDNASMPRVVMPIIGNLEPSLSSPVHVEHKISVQDIEPQKRNAFADLITSWNTGGSTNNDMSILKEDPEQFFSHVAEEQRDIGFAGIRNEETAILNTNTKWDVNNDEDINPWN